MLHDGPECGLTLTRLLPADLLADDAEAALQLPLGAVPREAFRRLVDRERTEAMEIAGEADRFEHRNEIVVARSRERRERGRDALRLGGSAGAQEPPEPGEKRRHMREFQ